MGAAVPLMYDSMGFVFVARSGHRSVSLLTRFVDLECVRLIMGEGCGAKGAGSSGGLCMDTD